jgi:PKD domain-containing protein/putative Ig domain-containing protein/Big-like domain-containing protein/cadherin-like protein
MEAFMGIQWHLRAFVMPAVVVGVLLAAVPASGQYMYLDSDGDGTHGPGDRINGLNVPTTVEVWLDTAHNRDGTPATCDTQDGPMTLSSYQFILHGTGGTVQYVSFRNLMPFNVEFGFARDSTDFTSGYGASFSLNPGLYHLGTLVVTGKTGTPALQFAASTPVSVLAVTAFGTQCAGNDFDNTYKLGTDWYDTDGLSPVGGPDRAPWVTAPATQTVIEGTPIIFTVTALDPDADPIQTLTATPLPPEATFTTASDNASGSFSWWPGYDAAAGSPYLVVFTAQNALVGMDTTKITVTNVDRPPELTAPATIHADENTLVTFQVLASDPDGDPIASLTAVIPEDASFTVAPGNASGTFAWTPGYSVGGGGLPVFVRFIARNGAIGQAGTDIYVNNVDRPPAVVAPASQSVDEALSLAFTVSASDPDGQAIGSLSAAPLPPGSTFTPGAGNVSGTFHWTPSPGQAGSYAVTFTASNAMSGSATTVITVVGGIDHAPVVTAPVNRFVSEGALVSFTVTASDPEGDEILSLTAAPLPPGAVFEPLAGNTSGALSWTPRYTQAGEYSIVFTASNALTGTATSQIVVLNVDGPPVVTAPSSVSGQEGSLVSVYVEVADPDGDPIDFLTAESLPAGSSFTAGPGNTSGSFVWTPSVGQSGNYLITISAKSACRAEVVSGVAQAICATGTATVTLAIAHADRPPVVTAPPTQTVSEGAPLSFTVTASDPDGQAITSLTAAPLPSGASFGVAPDATAGTFSWVPEFSQAGTYQITFTASDLLSGSAVSSITVADVNRAPVANAGGPYSGVAGVPVSLDGSDCSDPDGDALTFSWDFGDQSGGTGATVLHTYSAEGEYKITLKVVDAGIPQLTASAGAAATIAAAYPARIFTYGAKNKKIRVGGAQSSRIWCAEVEPIASSFICSSVIPSSLVMMYSGKTIAAQSSKTVTAADLDGNGIQEITVCFKQGDFTSLGFPSGTSNVVVALQGELVSGGRFGGDLSVQVVNETDDLVASVSPNPLNPAGTLTFTVTRAGSVRVTVFDLNGRLVRTLMDESNLGKGFYDLAIDSRGAGGEGLSSGVYFYRIETAAGAIGGRFTILK